MKKQKSTQTRAVDKLLGDYVISHEKFAELDPLFKSFSKKEFANLSDQQKLERVNRTLFDLIQKETHSSFLLVPIVDFIDRIASENVLEHYNFSSFELWLNQFSGLKKEENYLIRSKIVGKRIPRDAYQIFFPIGMGKSYPGSHYVTAHGSPDLDTTVASFWGWIDAFAARVGEGLHVWNLPGGPPPSIEIGLLFNQIFGENVFTHLIKDRSTLSVSSLDIMTQKGVIKKQTAESTLMIDHERAQNAVILVDEQGNYLGDWRSFDVEGVRQVIMLLNSCLRWFENNLQVKLISLFSKKNLTQKDLPDFIDSVFGLKIKDCQRAREFTPKQLDHLQAYLSKVLKVSKGLESTFEEFSQAMKALGINAFQDFIKFVESLKKSSIFDKSGALVENRTLIFNQLEKIIQSLDVAIEDIRSYVDRLSVALDIKSQVFGYLPQSVSYHADIEEVRSKMGNYQYLTVTSLDKQGNLFPLGVIQANDIHQSILGSVSLRDFCNRDETKIPTFLEVISVIDHHKMILNTFSPPVVYISDSQSSNALVAELAFQINDVYSTGGMSIKEIDAEISALEKNLSTPSKKRIMQRLLKRHVAAEHKDTYYIDPRREFIEYLHFLYAILDDTDLLTKVSQRDIECVASLLNRLKSLMLRKEVEIVQFDDLKRDKDFVNAAAKRVLQHPEMYSLYRKIYLAKERSIEHNLELCAKGKQSNIFADTKEQNGCCRVGQTKIFAKNFALFEKFASGIRAAWYAEALNVYKEKSEVDLHIHMFSTVAGADDLYAGTGKEFDHQDEMWIWIPSTEQAAIHLRSFLNAFRKSPALINNKFEVEFLGENAQELGDIFKESFIPIPRTKQARTKTERLPIAILKFKAGSINSRKAMISPYLPRLI